MANILCIDTATEKALVCISREGKTTAFFTNDEQKSHATFVQPAIAALLEKTRLSWSQINAIAVSNGPGSYTGLRVGLASAKGLAYALNKPLILINTLTVMAKNAAAAFPDCNVYFAPLIDARRMEVFAAVYDKNLNEILAPAAHILTFESFHNLLQQHKIMFFGSGAEKWQNIMQHSHARFEAIATHDGLSMLAQQYFKEKNFADIAYAEPYYLKSFYTTQVLK